MTESYDEEKAMATKEVMGSVDWAYEQDKLTGTPELRCEDDECDDTPFRTIRQIVNEVSKSNNKELDILASLIQREIAEFENVGKVVAALRTVRGMNSYLILAAYVQGLHARYE